MDIFKTVGEWLKGVMPWESDAESGGVPSAFGRTSTSAVMKSRQQTLEMRYQILEDQQQVETIFKRLAVPLLELCDTISSSARVNGGGRVILRELGTTDDRRSYVFMKPMSEYGWLMERSGAGWRTSRAEKIIGDSVFMRSHQDPWDVVTVWKDPQGEGLTRVRSQRFGGDLLSMPEYWRRLSESYVDIFTGSLEH
jgi:hypothetical protein